jgi:hypothetical protein
MIRQFPFDCSLLTTVREFHDSTSLERFDKRIRGEFNPPLP